MAKKSIPDDLPNPFEEVGNERKLSDRAMWLDPNPRMLPDWDGVHPDLKPWIDTLDDFGPENKTSLVELLRSNAPMHRHVPYFLAHLLIRFELVDPDPKTASNDVRKFLALVKEHKDLLVQKQPKEQVMENWKALGVWAARRQVFASLVECCDFKKPKNRPTMPNYGMPDAELQWYQADCAVRDYMKNGKALDEAVMMVAEAQFPLDENERFDIAETAKSAATRLMSEKLFEERDAFANKLKNYHNKKNTPANLKKMYRPPAEI